MRKALTIVAALYIGSSLVGCSQSSQPTSLVEVKRPIAPPAASAPTAQPTWALRLQSKCEESVTPDQCVGVYGFTLLANGEYQLGPGPQGEIRKGKLTDDEVKSILDTLGGDPNTLQTSAEAHSSIEAAESEDTVTYTPNQGDEQTLLKASGTDLIYSLSSADTSKNLLINLRALAKKYYALPFPDDCTDGATSVHSLLSSMQSCTSDSECTYLDNSFDVLDTTASQTVTTDDCSLIPPLVIGNSSSVKTNKDKIQESIDKIKNACGPKFYRDDCTVATINLTAGTTPACLQGVCQPRSAQLRFLN